MHDNNTKRQKTCHPVWEEKLVGKERKCRDRQLFSKGGPKVDVVNGALSWRSGLLYLCKRACR